MLNEAVDMVGKAGEIVSVLRTMMSQGKGMVERVDAIASICAALPIVEGDARSRGIKFVTQLPQGPIFVTCNSVMLQRLLLNLVVNAFDAFESAKITSPTLHLSGELKPDPFDSTRQGVSLTLSDNGPGMSTDELDNLFKPFSSTKVDGLGVGLSLAQILLRAWGGHITPQLNEGGGMRFTLWLPIARP